MPTARGGSKPNGARGKPVTLVKMATMKNKAVQAPKACPVNRPYSTISPTTISTRLTRT